MARSVGRPTKFTKKTRDRIYDSIRRGGTQQIIARRARVGVSTMLAWLAKGIELSEEVENGELDYELLSDNEKDFIEFSERYYEDESEYLLGLIEGTNDNKWLLTRRMKEQFGDESTLNLNANVKMSWKDIVEKANLEDSE